MLKRSTIIFALLLATVMAAAQTAPGTEKAQRLLEKGVMLLDAKRAGDAEPILRQAAAADPTRAVALFYLGSAEMTLNKYAAAADSFGRALSLDAANPGLGRTQRREATDGMGLAYSFLGNLAKAKAIYEGAVAKDPDYPGFSYNLACVCAQAGDRTGVLASLRAALAADAKAESGPTLPDPAADEDLKALWGDPAFQAILIMNLGPQPDDGPGGRLVREGARDLASGDPAGALAKIKAGVEAAPDLPRGWYFLGGALDALKRGDEAAKAYGKALQLNVAPNAVLSKPMVRYAGMRSAEGLMAAGKFGEAAEALKIAEAATPNYALVYYSLARAYAGLGNESEAQSALTRALSLKDQLLPLDPPLPDPAADPAFSKWAKDKGWIQFLAGLKA